MKLGRYIQGSVSPSGNDQFIAFTVLTAPPTHHIYINAMDAFGGDTNQTVQFLKIPTNAILPNAETKAGDVAGALQLCNFGAYALTQPAGQTNTNQRTTAGSADQGRGATQLPVPVALLPAGYSLVVTSLQNFTNSFTANAGGFMVAVDA